MAKLVKSDGSITDVSPQDGTSFTLKEMQDHVGGLIDILPSNSPLFELVINDDGKLDDWPINHVATSMYSEIGMALDDYIVGDVLIGTQKEMGSDLDETGA